MNKEFHEASTRVEDRIDDGLMTTKTINNLEKIFQDAENNHKIGPSNHDTSRTPALGTSVNLAKAPGQRTPINVQRPPGKSPSNQPGAWKDKCGSYPKGSCSMHTQVLNHSPREGLSGQNQTRQFRASSHGKARTRTQRGLPTLSYWIAPCRTSPATTTQNTTRHEPAETVSRPG